MGSTREGIEEFKINLLNKMHDEIREELNKMAQYWKDHASTWRQKMETWKTKMNTRDGRANGDTASQPAKTEMRTWKTEMETAKTVRRVKRSSQLAKHIVKVATDTQVHEESSRHATSPLKGSAMSSRKHQQARPVLVRRQHLSAQTRKQRRHSRSSKPKTEVRSTKPPEHGRLPRSRFLQWRLRLSSHMLCSCVKVVWSLAYQDVINRKRPFDRGKVRIMEKLFSKIGMNFGDKVLLEGGVLMRVKWLTKVNQWFGVRRRDIIIVPKLMELSFH
ncbi:hypothetical protein IGI04_006198 [Brassica rapa subsp. trilocularis]|uniref:Uncharacterized protein n=1 Tax=Brassica rapa subsp. trilocularis TaxID=1813537 RepID=A0ABQ7NG97_BRACM|nr:hypothetical protein IGI04_006198 [Brassica rapa subsp. trilocularis]